MSGPMSDARLAEIRAEIGENRCCHTYSGLVARELLAEVERTREDNELATAITKAASALRAIFWLLVSCVTGIFTWDLCAGVLGAPWWVAFGACVLAGVPVGWLSARQEGSDD